MSIVDNRKATHDYFIEDRYEAGLVLEGWEVKAIRAGHVQLKASYVIVRDGEIWIIGMHISPLPTASTHIHPNATPPRNLLLKVKEIRWDTRRVATECGRTCSYLWWQNHKQK